MNYTDFDDNVLGLDMKEFGIKTRPNITFVGCKIGELDCEADWRGWFQTLLLKIHIFKKLKPTKAILTPYGACYVMKITNSEPSFQIF